MKKGIILYQSKYGASKKYAGWLAELTGYDCEETKKFTLAEAEQYETIVLCGGIYASGIAGLSFLKKHIKRFAGKKIAVFCTGASPYDEKAFEAIKKHNLKDELNGIPLFYGRGAWDESRMSFTDKALCKMLKRAVSKKSPADFEPWMKALMDASGQACDWTNKKYLTPLLDYLKNDLK